MTDNQDSLYTSKIARAGALLADTKTLLAHWDENLSVNENLKRAREGNIFAKNSRSWIEQFLGAFRQRYLSDESTARALATLVKNSLPAESLDPILYFYTARSDALLHDIIVHVLIPLRAQGRTEVSTSLIEATIRHWIDEGRTTGQWADITITKAAQKSTAILRDFGVLHGKTKKHLAPIYLPVGAFAFVAMVLRQGEPSGGRLINHPEWQLFFLSPEAVERFFVDAHQHHLLEYQASGSVIRLTFPANSVEEYAHVVLQRTP